MGDRRKPSKINPDEVDPSVYYYDEIYDDDKIDKTDSELNTKNVVHMENVGSKYISAIKEEADLRKTEKEIRKFKKYARDRIDGDSDEEVFVTSSYKRRLAEIRDIEKAFKLDSKLDEEKEKSSKAHNKKPDTTSKTSDTTCDTGPIASSSGLTPTRKKFTTYEEKKKFLRAALAKRTVGKVYWDAVKRYKQRKAISKA